MNKIFYFLLATFLFISCSNNSTTNAPENINEKEKQLQALDSLYKATKAVIPENWKTRQTIFYSVYNPAGTWDSSQIINVSYFSGSGDYYESMNQKDYCKIFDNSDLLSNIVRTENCYSSKCLGLLLSSCDITTFNSNQLKFGNSRSYYEYNAYNKILKATTLGYIESSNTQIFNYYYNGSKIERSERSLNNNLSSIEYYIFNPNGYINKVLFVGAKNSDTSLLYTYTQDNEGRMQSYELVNKYENYTHKFIYSYTNNTITRDYVPNSSGTDASFCIKEVETYQDNNYSKLISDEKTIGDKNGKVSFKMSVTYEYGANYIINRDEQDNIIRKFILGADNRISEIIVSSIYTNVPIYKLEYVYTEKK